MTLPFALIQLNSSHRGIIAIKIMTAPMVIDSGLGRVRQEWSHAMRNHSLLEGTAVLERLVKVLLFCT